MSEAARPEATPDQHPEPHGGGELSQRLNWLRAGVLGANDGIVSTAGLVVGVAGATAERAPIATAGIAGLVAGAVSMALGEYVSVSSQRDSERAQLVRETRELAETPEQELAELVAIYEAKGLSPATARQVALELTEHDALSAHLDVELHLDPEELTSPWRAAGGGRVGGVVRARRAAAPGRSTAAPRSRGGCPSPSSWCSRPSGSPAGWEPGSGARPRAGRCCA